MKALRVIEPTSVRESGDSPARLNDDADKLAEPKKARKPTATEYAAKMELADDKKTTITTLAERFECKAFLPTFGHVANFCETYGIDVPASRTRASAIPRVFKFLANEMEAEEVQRILDDGMFSGPSRLGPIADAIRRNGRASRANR